MANHINGWFKPSASPARLLVRSKAYSLFSHFVSGYGSARCQQAGCELCDQLGEAKETLVFVVDRAGALFLLELNCDALASPIVCGDVLVVSRRKLGDLTETFVRRDGHDPCGEIWPHNYLAAIGQKLYDRVLASRLAVS